MNWKLQILLFIWMLIGVASTVVFVGRMLHFWMGFFT